MSALECTTPGCSRPSRAQHRPGLCPTCYAAKRRGSEIGKFRLSLSGKMCGVPGCARGQYAQGLCNMHYQRERNFGSAGRAEPLRWDWRGHGVARRPNFLSDRPDDVPSTPEGVVLRAEYEEILRHDPCSYCGAPPTSEVDHIDPYSRGGSAEWDNLTAACRSCNSRKNNWTLLDFLSMERTRERV